MEIEISVQIDGDFIKGRLSKNAEGKWEFDSNEKIFLKFFPNGKISKETASDLYNIDRAFLDPVEDEIYCCIFKKSEFFLYSVPDIINEGNYKKIKTIVKQMSYENDDPEVYYVCAPINLGRQKVFKADYYPERIDYYRPRYQELMGIFEVKKNIEFSNDEEIEYDFRRVYTLSFECMSV